MSSFTKNGLVLGVQVGEPIVGKPLVERVDETPRKAKTPLGTEEGGVGWTVSSYKKETGGSVGGYFSPQDTVEISGLRPAPQDRKNSSGVVPTAYGYCRYLKNG